LRKLGYVEGQNIKFEFRYAEGNRERQPGDAAELVRNNVDLIVIAGGDIEIRAAMKATKTIPLVMVGQGSDPVEAGFIESLARPGGNVTGLTILNRELGGKRLELLKEAVPKLARVTVLFNPALPGISREVKEDLPVAARALKLTVQSREIRTEKDFDTVFAALNKDRPDGLYVSLASALMRLNQKRITDFALKSRSPSVYDNNSAVDDGGLMYYGADRADSYQRVAYYVDKILKGAKPADLPVQQPMKFEFVINLRAANQIGITIPPDLLGRATRIIR
jgi:putative ABC transport system substrate-binding protein